MAKIGRRFIRELLDEFFEFLFQFRRALQLEEHMRHRKCVVHAAAIAFGIEGFRTGVSPGCNELVFVNFFREKNSRALADVPRTRMSIELCSKHSREYGQRCPSKS